jgi:hypothetical protein
MKLRWWMALIFAAATLAAAEPELELIGVTGNGRDYQVALKTKTGEPQWIAVGKQYGGYTVVRYDPKEEVAVLARNGQQFQVRLRQSKIAPGGPVPTAELPPPIKEGITRNLRMLAAAADQYYLENGRSTATYDDLVGPTRYVGALDIRAGENYRAVQFVQGRTMQVTTSSGHNVNYAP